MREKPRLRVTRDYSIFELHELNRDLKEKPLLLESMKAHGFMPSGAIHCIRGAGGKLKVVRGHHRLSSAKDIDAHLHNGGRADALKHALGANALHGHRRSNADKRRCVEIALREFPKLSSRGIAKLCGVGDQLVNAARPKELAETASSTRTGLDGKERHVSRQDAPVEALKPGPDDGGLREKARDDGMNARRGGAWCFVRLRPGEATAQLGSATGPGRPRSSAEPRGDVTLRAGGVLGGSLEPPATPLPPKGHEAPFGVSLSC